MMVRKRTLVFINLLRFKTEMTLCVFRESCATNAAVTFVKI